jgi:hypothetical protein
LSGGIPHRFIVAVDDDDVRPVSLDHRLQGRTVTPENIAQIELPAFVALMCNVSVFLRLYFKFLIQTKTLSSFTFCYFLGEP